MQKGETKKNIATKVDAVKASTIKSEIDKKEPIKVSETKVEVKAETKASTTKVAAKKTTTKSTATAKKESVSKKTTTRAKKPTAAKAKKTAEATKKVIAKEEVKVNLAEVIGNAEIKLIPDTSNKTAKEYPISAAVKNLGLIKDVVVRYTIDNWASCEESPLDFKYQEGDFELWSTTISFDEKSKDSFKYCLRYTVNDVTRWDNNEDNDYTF